MDNYFNPIYSTIIFIYNQSNFNTINRINIESTTSLPHRCQVDPVSVWLSRWLVWSRWSALSIYILYTIRYNTIYYIRLTIDNFISLLPIR